MGKKPSSSPRVHSKPLRKVHWGEDDDHTLWTRQEWFFLCSLAPLMLVVMKRKTGRMHHTGGKLGTISSTFPPLEGSVPPSLVTPTISQIFRGKRAVVLSVFVPAPSNPSQSRPRLPSSSPYTPRPPAKTETRQRRRADVCWVYRLNLFVLTSKVVSAIVAPIHTVYLIKVYLARQPRSCFRLATDVARFIIQRFTRYITRRNIPDRRYFCIFNRPCLPNGSSSHVANDRVTARCFIYSSVIGRQSIRVVSSQLASSFDAHAMRQYRIGN